MTKNFIGYVHYDSTVYKTARFGHFLTFGIFKSAPARRSFRAVSLKNTLIHSARTVRAAAKTDFSLSSISAASAVKDSNGYRPMLNKDETLLTAPVSPLAAALNLSNQITHHKENEHMNKHDYIALGVMFAVAFCFLAYVAHLYAESFDIASAVSMTVTEIH